MGESASGGTDELTAFTYELDPAETASEGVVRAIAAVSDQRVTPARGDADAMPPLFDAIDPDALDRLHERLAHGRSDAGRIAFHYDGYEVTVRKNGPVTVRSDG